MQALMTYIHFFFQNKTKWDLNKRRMHGKSGRTKIKDEMLHNERQLYLFIANIFNNSYTYGSILFSEFYLYHFTQFSKALRWKFLLSFAFYGNGDKYREAQPTAHSYMSKHVCAAQLNQNQNLYSFIMEIGQTQSPCLSPSARACTCQLVTLASHFHSFNFFSISEMGLW